MMELTKEHKQFLEKLRRSGTTNMYGAAPYLRAKFGMNKPESYEVLARWMQTYDREDPDYAEL